jgi:DNA-binding beta-propeller fold protein YncE
MVTDAAGTSTTVRADVAGNETTVRIPVSAAPASVVLDPDVEALADLRLVGP